MTSRKSSTKRVIAAAIVAAALLFVSEASAQRQQVADDYLKALTDTSTINPGFFSEGLDAQSLREQQIALGRTEAQGQNDVSAWERFLTILSDFIRGGGAQHVQFLSTYQGADWNDPTYGQYRVCRLIGDTIPEWGSGYKPRTGKSFGDEYGVFIQNLVLPLTDPSVIHQADSARTNWLASLDVLQAAQAAVGPHWQRFDQWQQSLPADRRLKFDIWYQRYDGQKIGALQQRADGLASTYQRFFNQAYGGYAFLADLITRFSSTTRVQALAPDSGVYEALYPYSVSPSLDDFIKTYTASPGTRSFRLDSSTSHYNSSQTTWGASASYAFFVRVGASGSSTNIDYNSQDFSVQFSVDAMQAFNVVPGQWFSADVVQFFKAGDHFIPGGPIDIAFKNKTLWGNENSVFALRTAQVVVALHPKVTVHLSNVDYHNATSSWNASAGIGIGPFSFGGSAGQTKVDIQKHDDTSTITAEDKSGVPQIIAVVTDILPDFN
jgi:hypothetical protein